MNADVNGNTMQAAALTTSLIFLFNSAKTAANGHATAKINDI
jgi:hypothetical protein